MFINHWSIYLQSFDLVGWAVGKISLAIDTQIFAMYSYNTAQLHYKPVLVFFWVGEIPSSLLRIAHKKYVIISIIIFSITLHNICVEMHYLHRMLVMAWQRPRPVHLTILKCSAVLAWQNLTLNLYNFLILTRTVTQLLFSFRALYKIVKSQELKYIKQKYLLGTKLQLECNIELRLMYMKLKKIHSSN